ncbi:tetratricopeptide repeat protein 5 [Fundulus heteroclitus]|uniref:tetratricopeptide repeat protein 5 n=1 Tax=Fundulus heteroclitus TaxID=8078 RepID=UPI00165AB5C3|nr:tetratricopeptide repeat protein 5 [Fundulus heteroclitus]XP_036002267.1 tetratricopeptide repeat protein 5 [Fundulus heteroclitus]
MAEKEESGEAGEDKTELQIIKELVDELYTFRDCYFETHGVEEAVRKDGDVKQKMEQTLKKLEEKEDGLKHKAEFLLQKGRCLNVAADFSADAEECLSQAVKLDPRLVEAWNILGDQYWKKGDLIASKNCFTGALQREKNKVSLRNLSMLLRQLPAASDDEHGKHVLESVDLARDAVQLDLSDGTSWCILGNAYLSMFFLCGQNPQFSQQALSAYAKSAADRIASSTPDLHFNRANLFQYEELFGCALEGYSRAAALDPNWKEPPEKEKQLLEHLDKVTELTRNKGKVKTRRLRTMLSSLNTSALGPCSSPQFSSPSGRVGSLEPRPLSSLAQGHNAGVAAMGKVVFSLASQGHVAFTFGMVDSEETCMAVMVYNTANSWGVLIGDSVVIPEPNVKRHLIEHKDKSYDFKSIRVDSPLLLFVNGKKQNVQSQIPTSISYQGH